MAQIFSPLAIYLVHLLLMNFSRPQLTLCDHIASQGPVLMAKVLSVLIEMCVDSASVCQKCYFF